MSCGRRGRAAPGAADARLRSGGEKPSPRRSRRCRPRRLPAQADHPTRAGPGSHDTQRPAATRLCLRLRGASAVLACGVRRKGRAEREEWAEGAARRGAGRRGLGRGVDKPRCQKVASYKQNEYPRTAAAASFPAWNQQPSGAFPTASLHPSLRAAPCIPSPKCSTVEALWTPLY